jgi:hypothetical protein
LDIDILDKLQQRYRADGNLAGVAHVDAAIAKKELDGVPQTAELANCGKLFKQRNVDPDTGRLTFRYTGDASVFLAPFVTAGISGNINDSLGRGANGPEALAYAAEQRQLAAEQQQLAAEGLAARAARASAKLSRPSSSLRCFSLSSRQAASPQPPSGSAARFRR